MISCDTDAGMFARQMTLPGWTPVHQDRLALSTVLVAGVGGIGGVVAQYLAMAGVKRLILVHSGKLELADLNRQTLMGFSAIGRSRVREAANRLQEQVPEVDIRTLDQPVDAQLTDIAGTADLLIDARLSFPERFALNRIACLKSKRLIVGAMNAMEGFVLNVDPKVTACLRCVFPEEDPDWEPLGFPVLGAVSGLIGAMVALEALRTLSGYGQPPVGGTMRFFDGTDSGFREYVVRRVSGCPDCGS